MLATVGLELLRRLNIAPLFELLVTCSKFVTDDPVPLVAPETGTVFEAAGVLEFVCAAAAAAAAAAENTIL
jgi:hypothetical protein